jgi:hypothetical protein
MRATPNTVIILLLLLTDNLSAQTFVDAHDHGCIADYQKIDCAITVEGRVSRIGGATFGAGDVGKILVIDAAHSWPAYSLDPVPLNARITAVDAGIATVKSIDDSARGALLSNPKTTAEFFTDNTDAIAKALEAQTSKRLSHVQLLEGIIGLCPFVSETWARNPVYHNYHKTRAIFVMKDGMVLKGQGKARTRLKIGYFGEFNPVRESPAFYSPVLFMFEPVADKTTTGEIASFTVEFPFSPVVQSGYSFVTDGWNVSPARHGLQVTLRDIATVNPQRNTVSINSYQGGIYGPENALVAESKYVIENCDFETVPRR